MSQTRSRILAVGEVLWDVFGDEERLGGAPFNFVANAARLGHDAALLSAVGNDPRGERALTQAKRLGVATELLQTVEGLPTGLVTVSVATGGQPSYDIHRPAAYDAVTLDADTLRVLQSEPPAWIYFGTLLQANESARSETKRLFDAFPECRTFYDVNLRPGCYDRALIAGLLPRAQVLKLNHDEATEIRRLFGEPASTSIRFARDYTERYGYDGVCVTHGAEGCRGWFEGEEFAASGYSTSVDDTVGAGDAFSAGFVHGLVTGWTLAETADFANRLGCLAASRAGAVPAWTLEEAWGL